MAYIQEHVNQVLLAGPISQVKEGREFFGKTSFSFLVGTNGERVRVQARVKNANVIKVAQNAKSVIVTGAYMSSYRKDKQQGVIHDMFGIDARSTGMAFLEEMINPLSHVAVEGVVVAMQQNWATIAIGYMSMVKETKTKIQGWRYANVLFKGPLSPQAMKTPILVVGKPVPKFNNEWLLHIVPSYAALMYGRK